MANNVLNFSNRAFPGFSDAERDNLLRGRIKVLQFSSSTFTEDSFADLCEVLSNPDCKVHTLSLSKARGIVLEQLCEALISNPKTRINTLNLSYLNIRDPDCHFVGRLIEFNTSMSVLTLNSNKFTAEGLATIHASFEKNKFLQDIHIYSMSGLDFADKTIYTIIARNRNNNDLKTLLANNLTQEKRVRWGRSKLMIIGQGRAGKTSTVRSLLGKEFNENEESTIGADLKKTETTAWKEENFMTANFNDAAAQVLLKAKDEQAEQFKKITEEFERQRQKAQEEGEGKLFDEVEETEQKEQEITRSNRNGRPSPQQTEQQAEQRPEPGRAEGRMEIDREPVIEDEFNDREQVQIVSETDVARRFGKKLLAKAVNNQQEEDPDKITFTIWDYGGQEVFYTLHHLFLTKYGVYLICFDMTELVNVHGDQEVNQEAVDYLLFWTNSVLLHAPKAPLLLVGTHLDKIHPAASTEAKVGEKEEKNIRSRFKFLRWNKANKPTEEPGVTYSDKELQEFRENYLTLINKTLVSQVQVNKNMNLIENLDSDKVFFPIDNVSKTGVEALRENIQNSVVKKYYVDQEIPLRWILACDFLIEDEDIRENWHYLDQVQKWSSEFGCNSMHEVKQFLKLFHELGVLIYLSSSELLRDRVISEPQWLINKLGLVIRDEELHGIPAEVPSFMHKEYKTLRKDGLVSLDILHHLWSWKKDKHPPKGVLMKLRKRANKNKKMLLEEEEKKEINFLLELMTHSMLISKWNFNSDNRQLYFIPCCMKESFKTSKKFKERTFEEQEMIVLDFTKFFLPTGVFQRLMCLICNILSDKLENKPENKPYIGKDFGFVKMPFEEQLEDLLLLQEGDKIEVRISSTEIASNCLELILSLTQKLREESMGSKLAIEIFVSDNKEMRGYLDVKKEGNKVWFKNKEEVEKLAAQVMDLETFLED